MQFSIQKQAQVFFNTLNNIVKVICCYITNNAQTEWPENNLFLSLRVTWADQTQLDSSHLESLTQLQSGKGKGWNPLRAGYPSWLLHAYIWYLSRDSRRDLGDQVSAHVDSSCGQVEHPHSMAVLGQLNICQHISGNEGGPFKASSHLYSDVTWCYLC